MITYQNASRRPAAFNSMFGFSVAAFDALYTEFEMAHQARLAQQDVTRKKGTPRKRQAGAGRKFRHALRERLLLALFWLRTYPTLELLGFFFDLDKTSAEDNLKDMLASLETLATFALEHPDRSRRKLRTVQQMMDAFPDVAVVIDAKEQRIQRPKNKKSTAPDSKAAEPAAQDSKAAEPAAQDSKAAEPAAQDSKASVQASENVQKPYYSGKKKCHTLKSQIGVRPDGLILAVSDSVPGGANHDLTLLRQTRLIESLEAGDAAMLDKGYDGIANDYPNKTLYLPFKARRNHPLTDEQKAYNRFLSSYRIVVEHTNAQLNVFQVLTQTYRHNRSKHTQIVRIVAALVNRRILATPLKTYAA